ncbi:MAG: hypothetical protein HY867_08090 [Chloroflexi bacterium]|nr:hypothetical protein [Chloroflexota bacterium]
MLNSTPASRATPKMPPPVREVKRKRGGQRGNSNARKHGLYAKRNPHPKAGFMRVNTPKVKLPTIERGDLSQIDHLERDLALNHRLLVRLHEFSKNSKTTAEILAWDRSILQTIRADMKIIRLIARLEQPYKDLVSLAQNASWLVNWEFEQRGIPERPIFVPLGFENFCAHPESSLERFRDNTIEVPATIPLFVPPNLINLRANLDDSTIPSPFLTDQQWFLIRDSFGSLREDKDSFRKYKRRKPRFSTRLLFEAVLLKLACNLAWEDLPPIVYAYHPDLASFPLRECQRLHRDLFNTGRLQAIYKQLHWHLRVYGDATLLDLVSQDSFTLGKNGIALSPGQSITWQLFTALLLLQRAFHNRRACQREKDAERRRNGRYHRLPSPRIHGQNRSYNLSISWERPFSSRSTIPEPSAFEPLGTSPAAKKWQAYEKIESLAKSHIRSPKVARHLEPDT